LSRDELWNCRVCGMRQPDPPWGEDGRYPLYDICQRCGTEAGYQDDSPESIAERQEQILPLRTFHALIEQFYHPLVINAGFRPSGLGFTRSIRPGWLGTLRLGYSIRPEEQGVRVTPAIGLRVDQLEDACALIGQGVDPYQEIVRQSPRPTIEVELSEHQQTEERPGWLFLLGDPFERRAREMVAEIGGRGMAWMQAHASIDTMLRLLQSEESDTRPSFSYSFLIEQEYRSYTEAYYGLLVRLLLAYWQAGRDAEARAELTTRYRLMDLDSMPETSSIRQIAARLADVFEHPYTGSLPQAAGHIDP
jgi:hypothetical protein